MRLRNHFRVFGPGPIESNSHLIQQHQQQQQNSQKLHQQHQLLQEQLLQQQLQRQTVHQYEQQVQQQQQQQQLLLKQRLKEQQQPQQQQQLLLQQQQHQQQQQQLLLKQQQQQQQQHRYIQQEVMSRQELKAEQSRRSIAETKKINPPYSGSQLPSAHLSGDSLLCEERGSATADRFLCNENKGKTKIDFDSELLDGGWEEDNIAIDRNISHSVSVTPLSAHPLDSFISGTNLLSISNKHSNCSDVISQRKMKNDENSSISHQRNIPSKNQSNSRYAIDKSGGERGRGKCVNSRYNGIKNGIKNENIHLNPAPLHSAYNRDLHIHYAYKKRLRNMKSKPVGATDEQCMNKCMNSSENHFIQLLPPPPPSPTPIPLPTCPFPSQSYPIYPTSTDTAPMIESDYRARTKISTSTYTDISHPFDRIEIIGSSLALPVSTAVQYKIDPYVFEDLIKPREEIKVDCEQSTDTSDRVSDRISDRVVCQYDKHGRYIGPKKARAVTPVPHTHTPSASASDSISNDFQCQRLSEGQLAVTRDRALQRLRVSRGHKVLQRSVESEGKRAREQGLKAVHLRASLARWCTSTSTGTVTNTGTSTSTFTDNGPGTNAGSGNGTGKDVESVAVAVGVGVGVCKGDPPLRADMSQIEGGIRNREDVMLSIHQYNPERKINKERERERVCSAPPRLRCYSKSDIVERESFSSPSRDKNRENHENGRVVATSDRCDIMSAKKGHHDSIGMQKYSVQSLMSPSHQYTGYTEINGSVIPESGSRSRGVVNERKVTDQEWSESDTRSRGASRLKREVHENDMINMSKIQYENGIVIEKEPRKEVRNEVRNEDKMDNIFPTDIRGNNSPSQHSRTIAELEATKVQGLIEMTLGVKSFSISNSNFSQKEILDQHFQLSDFENSTTAINSDNENENENENENNNRMDHINPLFMGPGSGIGTRPVGQNVFPSEINNILPQILFNSVNSPTILEKIFMEEGDMTVDSRVIKMKSEQFPDNFSDNLRIQSPRSPYALNVPTQIIENISKPKDIEITFSIWVIRAYNLKECLGGCTPYVLLDWGTFGKRVTKTAVDATCPIIDQEIIFQYHVTSQSNILLYNQSKLRNLSPSDRLNVEMDESSFYSLLMTSVPDLRIQVYSSNESVSDELLGQVTLSNRKLQELTRKDLDFISDVVLDIIDEDGAVAGSVALALAGYTVS